MVFWNFRKSLGTSKLIYVSPDNFKIDMNPQGNLEKRKCLAKRCAKNMFFIYGFLYLMFKDPYFLYGFLDLEEASFRIS